MEKKQIPILVRALILATLLVSSSAVAQDGGSQNAAEPAVVEPAAASTTAASEPLGTGFTYQGKLDQDGSPVNDDCDMVFRLFDQQVGGTQISDSITKTVSIVDGLFTVNLNFGADAFNGDRRWLKISVDCEQDGTYTALGREKLTAAPYALYALYAAESAGLQNVVTVAQSGGDYSSIQAAIDSITDATVANPYLVWVAPGVYSETVTMKPHVHLQGAGQRATTIDSTVSDDLYPPLVGTLTLASNTSLRDLTVRNNGTGDYNTALLVPSATQNILVADVTVRARGSGSRNYTIHVDSVDNVTLLHVKAVAENGSFQNLALSTEGQVTLHGGSFTGRGGSIASGIGNGGTLEATGITALGTNGSDSSTGLSTGGEVTLHGGSFIGRGGSDAHGISNGGTEATLEATGITALGENGTESYGLYHSGTLTATAEINSSRLIGSDYGLRVDGASARVGVTQLDGGAYVDSGTLTCFQVYDENYAAYSCP